MKSRSVVLFAFWLVLASAFPALSMTRASVQVSRSDIHDVLTNYRPGQEESLARLIAAGPSVAPEWLPYLFRRVTVENLLSTEPDEQMRWRNSRDAAFRVLTAIPETAESTLISVVQSQEGVDDGVLHQLAVECAPKYLSSPKFTAAYVAWLSMQMRSNHAMQNALSEHMRQQLDSRCRFPFRRIVCD